jgi:hypothetical protein
MGQEPKLPQTAAFRRKLNYQLINTSDLGCDPLEATQSPNSTGKTMAA